MTVAELILQLQTVPNPSKTDVAITTTAIRTNHETPISLNKAQAVEGGIDLADAGRVVLQDS